MYVRASHIHNKTSYFHFIIGLMAVVFIPCVSIIFWICLNPDMKPRHASSMRVDLDKVVATETYPPTTTECRNPIQSRQRHVTDQLPESLHLDSARPVLSIDAHVVGHVGTAASADSNVPPA